MHYRGFVPLSKNSTQIALSLPKFNTRQKEDAPQPMRLLQAVQAEAVEAEAVCIEDGWSTTTTRRHIQ